MLHEGWRCTDHQCCGFPGSLRHHLDTIGDARKASIDILCQQSAGSTDRNAVCTAFKQRHAKTILQLSDLSADGARLGAGVGVGLGFTFEFVFVAWGLNYTLASHMSVFLYTAPVFGVLFGALLLDDPLTTNFLIGGAMLMIGIVLVTRQK